MEELKKYKQKIIFNLVLLFVLGIISIVLLIGAAPSFSSSGFAIVLMVIFLINVPLFVSTGLLGIKVINSYSDSEQKKMAISDTAIEELDKEVEEKVKEADDLAFNLNILSDDMPKFSDWKEYGHGLLAGISKQLEIVIGLVYVQNNNEFNVVSDYAYYADSIPVSFEMGEGLSGQAAKDKKAIFLTEIPEGYMHVISGLGQNKPRYLSIIPIVKNNQVVGIVELATFMDVGKGFKRRADEISEFIGKLAPEITINK